MINLHRNSKKKKPSGKPLVQWQVLGNTDLSKNTNVLLFYLHVVKSILVQCFVLVFHVIKTK